MKDGFTVLTLECGVRRNTFLLRKFHASMYSWSTHLNNYLLPLVMHSHKFIPFMTITGYRLPRKLRHLNGFKLVLKNFDSYTYHRDVPSGEFDIIWKRCIYRTRGRNSAIYYIEFPHCFHIYLRNFKAA